MPPAAELLRIDNTGASRPRTVLDKADIALEHILRSERFAAVRWERCTVKVQTVEDYRLRTLTALEADGYPGDDFTDEARTVDQIHALHSMGLCFLCEEGFLHEGEEGQRQLS